MHAMQNEFLAEKNHRRIWWVCRIATNWRQNLIFSLTKNAAKERKIKNERERQRVNACYHMTFIYLLEILCGLHSCFFGCSLSFCHYLYCNKLMCVCICHVCHSKDYVPFRFVSFSSSSTFVLTSCYWCVCMCVALVQIKLYAVWIRILYLIVVLMHFYLRSFLCSVFLIFFVFVFCFSHLAAAMHWILIKWTNTLWVWLCVCICLQVWLFTVVYRESDAGNRCLTQYIWH